MPTKKELAERFRKLGASDPESWAHSQIEEGIPQLAIFLFLKKAWSLVVSEADHSWISENLKTSVERPGGGVVPALERTLACGAAEQDLTTIVRVMQWRLLAGLCVLMDDPDSVEPRTNDVGWRLFQVDGDGRPIKPIGGLIESLLDTEPSGREMRPQ